MKSKSVNSMLFSKYARRWHALISQLKESPYYRLESILIVGSIVVGMAAAALNNANSSAVYRAMAERYKLTNIYVAKHDLIPGDTVGPDTVVIKEILFSSHTPNMVDQETLASAMGRHLEVELKSGDPVLLSFLEGLGTNSIAGKIPPGKRLFSLQISDRVAGNGWIKPNDHVDIIAHMDLPMRGATTFTLLQDITLVSVGRATVWDRGNSSEGSEIGFYVLPEELELLRFAQSKGQFSLALRNPNDIASQNVSSRDLGKEGVDMKKFLDHSMINRASGGGDLPITIGGHAPSLKHP